MSDRSVLLVDDNPDDIALAERALKRSGISATLLVANSGKAAWEQLSGTTPRAVFLDLNMPEWNGFELLERLRADERTKHLPVVILTTSREPADILRSYDLGANSYVTKPLDFTEFTAVFGRMMHYWVDTNQAVAS